MITHGYRVAGANGWLIEDAVRVLYSTGVLKEGTKR